jgi:CSLREA domain-containing protein
MLLALALGAPPAGAVDFVVTSTADLVDAVPGDGICAATGGGCTLRAAILEANALAGADRILLASARYRLTRVGPGTDAGDLDVLSDVAIVGGADSRLEAAPGVDGLLDFAESGADPDVRATVSDLQILDTAPGSGGCIRSTAKVALANVRCSGQAGVTSAGFETGTTAEFTSTFP